MAPQTAPETPYISVALCRVVRLDSLCRVVDFWRRVVGVGPEMPCIFDSLCRVVVAVVGVNPEMLCISDAWRLVKSTMSTREYEGVAGT